MKIKKLWLLRLYMSMLEYASLLVLISYMYYSIKMWTDNSETSKIGSILLSVSGIYFVVLSIILLFAAQIVELFISIHDNVRDVRNKTLMPELQLTHFQDSRFQDGEYNEYDKIKNRVLALSIGGCLLCIVINFNYNGTSSSTTANPLPNSKDNIEAAPAEAAPASDPFIH